MPLKVTMSMWRLPRWLVWFQVIVLACSVIVLLGGALGALSPLLAPLSDLSSLLALPAALVAVLAGASLLLRQRRGLHRAMLLACMLPSLVIFTPEKPQERCPPGARRLKVAWLNIHRSSAPAPILAWLAHEQPQIVGFGELDKRSVALRSRLEGIYPHYRSCLANGRCSTVLYGRSKPFTMASLAKGDPENRKALSAVRMSLPSSGQADGIPIVAVHLSRPFPLGRQRQELRELQSFLPPSPRLIVIGDFNMSPRMSALKGFAKTNGLRINKTAGPTWPIFTGGLWQIDHILTGKGWIVTGIRTSPDLGSDHRGIVADLCAAADFG